MEQEEPQLTPAEECCRRLNVARKNYRLAVRWYREVLCYRGAVSGFNRRGDEWKQEAEEGWLADDAQFAYDEVISDIKRYREAIGLLTKQWHELKEKENDGK